MYLGKSKIDCLTLSLIENSFSFFQSLIILTKFGLRLSFEITKIKKFRDYDLSLFVIANASGATLQP